MGRNLPPASDRPAAGVTSRDGEQMKGGHRYPTHGHFPPLSSCAVLLIVSLAVPRKPAPDQVAGGEFLRQMDVAHETGAAAAAFQNDLAVVEGFELGAVTHTDDGSRV